MLWEFCFLGSDHSKSPKVPFCLISDMNIGHFVQQIPLILPQSIVRNSTDEDKVHAYGDNMVFKVHSSKISNLLLYRAVKLHRKMNFCCGVGDRRAERFFIVCLNRQFFRANCWDLQSQGKMSVQNDLL